VAQLEVRKTELVRNTDQLSHNLKESIEKSNFLKSELLSVENLVKQYEQANRRVMEEMEEQARQNEEIVNQLQRNARVNELKDKMAQDLNVS
jgi:hypothetical protein